MKNILSRLDEEVIRWMSRNGHLLLRLSISIIYIWFGALKFYKGSDINQFVTKVVDWIDPSFFIPVLAVWEILIGLGFLFRRFLRVTLVLLFMQMLGVFMTLFTAPELCFTHAPFAPTIEGQYIVKNLLIISAAFVIGGTIHRESTGSGKRI